MKLIVNDFRRLCLNTLSEVFSHIVLDAKMQAFAGSCMVDKILVNKNRNLVTVILGENPDADDNIFIDLARNIKKQIFNDLEIEVKLLPVAKEMSETEEKVRHEIKTTAPKKIIGAGEKRYNSKLSKDDSNGVIYGRDFCDEPSSISLIEGPCNDVCVSGKIFEEDQREYQQGKMVIYTISITDLSDSINIKLFLEKKDAEALSERLKNAKSGIVVKGSASLDTFDKELIIGRVFGIKEADSEQLKAIPRVDTCEEKRVELHCHTQMSEMDGMINPVDLIKQVHSWGHKAVAITDHGVVQAFTKAMHAVDGLDDFKVIYGMEGYLVDDLKRVVENPKKQSLDTDYVVFDIETTGLNASQDQIIEIGAVRVCDNKITDSFQSFVNPNRPIPFEIKKLTGIDDKDVRGADDITVILRSFLEFAKDSVIVGHNVGFDMGFILEACSKQNIVFNPTVVDTVPLSRNLLQGLKNYKLDTVAKHLEVELLNHHRADQDAGCTAEILIKLIEIAKSKGITLLDELNIMTEINIDSVKKTHPNHVIILVENEIGRVNLYKLVSMSHLKYFNRKPRIPKSELIKHRQGLIIGSACSQGELYDAVLLGKNKKKLEEIADFYDYLEIQPISNNLYLTRGASPKVNGVEGLRDINKTIVELGRALNKPVVATTDAHFLNPEDEIYRKILLHGQKFKNCDDELPVYVRTTNEMLDEFAYLGENIAYDVVIKNTNLIADRIQKISPVRPDKCPPIIENSDVMLKEICYESAEKIYGKPLPNAVGERLDKELSSIIGNGYAVMYIIARKLVKNSNENGYIVGSRGSVGSSLVATMAGITEVNPLPPHYYCPHCNYNDFDSDMVKGYARGSGCDMPDMVCPVCGEPLLKDGFDIPFETFLGFNGDKEPDIDLNFSGEYQATAHKYTEEIFGHGNTFKAGTVGTIAQKTAIGFIKGYFEEKNIIKRRCELNRLASYLMGVRRSTGQHPGGIVILPKGEDITTFTPVQHPANDVNSDVITTHFDYHSIDHNLLKLDILGHDDPSMIKMLEDLTGFSSSKISLADKSVLSLFNSTEALNITPDSIGGCKLGVLGIPEFGTDFVMQMLLDTKPKSFSDLVRISGLSHGTNVWTGNAQILVKEGIADLAGAICTRDDIMLYLIEKHLEPSKAFTIMEQVRKGKGLKSDQEEYMLENDVPKWYIDSCKKISYMFPKAHAAAYVMMAYRIAYYKIFYPLAYYAAFYSIRATGFDYVSMCMGIDILNQHISEYTQIKHPSATEKDMNKAMLIVREMYARGIDFVPIDIYKANATRFIICENKIMPALTSISGLGITVAKTVEKEAAISRFTSIEDFKNRTKTDQTTIDKLIDLGILKDLPESAQLSLFDFMK